MKAKSPDRSVLLLPKEVYLGDADFDLADCYSDNGSSFNDRLHFHDFYELSVFYEGRSDFLVSGERFVMGERSVQLIRPSDYHRQNVAPGDHIRYFNLMFTDSFLPPALREMLDADSRPLCMSLPGGGEWSHLLTSVRYAKAQFDRSPDDALTALLCRSLVELLCYTVLRGRDLPGGSESGTWEEAVRIAISFVQKNYRRPITLGDAASAAGLSQAYFSTLFRQVTGVPFSDYLASYRLKIADRYLHSGDLPIKQIASLCGFSSPGYFITRYRRQYGNTPKRAKEGRGTGDE